MNRKDLTLGIILGICLGVFVTLFLAPKMYPHINIPKLQFDEAEKHAYRNAYKNCMAAMQWSEIELAGVPHSSVETSFDGMPQWQHIAPGQVAHVIVENGKYIGMKIISTKGEDLGTQPPPTPIGVTITGGGN